MKTMKSIFHLCLCVGLVLITSCNDNDEPSIDPVLVTVNWDSPETFEEPAFYAVATDENGMLIGLDSLSSRGSFQIMRPEGFDKSTYNLYILEKGIDDIEGQVFWEVRLFHKTNLKVFNDHFVKRLSELKGNGSYKLRASYGGNSCQTKVSYGFQQEDILCTLSSVTEVDTYANVNNDIFYHMTVGSQYYYNSIAITGSEGEITIPLELENLSNDVSTYNLSFTDGITEPDLSISAFGAGGWIDWSKNIYSGTINENQTNISLPRGLDWISGYVTDVGFDDGNNFYHEYYYYNEIPETISKIEGLSAVLTGGKVTITGEYDFFIYNHYLTKDNGSGSLEVDFTIFSDDSETLPTEIPDFVKDLMSNLGENFFANPEESYAVTMVQLDGGLETYLEGLHGPELKEEVPLSMKLVLQRF